MKLGRNYLLTIETPSGTLTIKPPTTVEFDIDRGTLGRVNYAKFRIYNLNEHHRNVLRKNRFNWGQKRKVTFSAGYGQVLSPMFSGGAQLAMSYREGVNFITDLEANDGGNAYATGLTNKSFPAGTPLSAQIRGLHQDLKAADVSSGAVGGYSQVSTRGATYSGVTMDILHEVTGGGTFIDSGRVHSLQDDEYIANSTGVAEINAKTGLLGTPQIEYTRIHFAMILEPGLQVGQKIRLTSLTEKNYNNDYKVIAVHHKGMISEAVAGEAITEATVVYYKSLKGVFAP